MARHASLKYWRTDGVDTETTTISGLRSGGGGGSGGGPQLTFGTPGALSNAAQRLGKVAEKFSTFYTDLEHERQVLKQALPI